MPLCRPALGEIRPSKPRSEIAVIAMPPRIAIFGPAGLAPRQITRHRATISAGAHRPVGVQNRRMPRA